MPHYLVTGGAGAIGSNLVAELVRRGDRVTVLDDLSSGRRELVHPEAELVVGSVTRDEDVGTAFAGNPDYVLHLAALFANQNSVEHPELDLAVNAGGTLRVLEAAVKHEVRKVLYVSSSCVYGDSAVMREDDGDLHPTTPYAMTKLLSEHYCRFFADHDGLDVVSVRLFNAYGPNEFPGRYRNVIPNFLALALRGEPLTITGTGEETRDFTFSRDIVDGMLLALQAPTRPGALFNLGSGRETRIVDLARLINELTDSKAEIEFVPRRGWDKVSRRRSDITLASEAFGYQPSTPLDAGLERTLAWLRSVLD